MAARAGWWKRDEGGRQLGKAALLGEGDNGEGKVLEEGNYVTRAVERGRYKGRG